MMKHIGGGIFSFEYKINKKIRNEQLFVVSTEFIKIAEEL